MASATSNASPAAAITPDIEADKAPADPTATAQLRHLMASSAQPGSAVAIAAATKSNADAAARLSNLLRSSVEPVDTSAAAAQLDELQHNSTEGVEYTVPETPEKDGTLSPRVSPFKLAAERTASHGARQGDTATVDSHQQAAPHADPNRSTSFTKNAQEPPCSAARAAKRRTSSHFEPAPKRRRSADCERMSAGLNPHGILGELVNKLQPRKPGSSTACSDEYVDIDLGRSSSADEDRLSSKFPSDAADDGYDSEKQRDAIAGLEHIQPFASVAKLAVESIKAASLQKFGMSQEVRSKHGLTKPSTDVLQPFAPPRRKVNVKKTKLPQNTRDSQTCIATSLQQFACSVTSNP